MSLTCRGTISSSLAGDKADVDAEADADSKPVARRAGDVHKSLTGMLRKVVWPASDVTAVCCASDECYL